jgi:UDP-2,4-diacetamido-2,4,6-trideoxy-beta-L-altropyranose hydrolase
MRFLFRADASTAIGAGHVVRCATLARQLVRAGHSARFLCRSSPGNLNVWLESEGFDVELLPPDLPDESADAEACLTMLEGESFDWLVVDHYQLGVAWETLLASTVGRLLVIDDVARPHACDLLLDQNTLNPQHACYPALVPTHCSLLLGPAFTLVRPEFSALRPASLSRRQGQLERLLVCMGGSDPENETTKVLAGLTLGHTPKLHVDVVIGGGNPHRAEVEAACARLPSARLHVQTAHMAELMAAADCAVNAGGSTTWERCTLGLPAIVAVSADNQVEIAQTVHQAGGHRNLGRQSNLFAADYAQAIADLTPEHLQSMSVAAARICDGHGAARVSACLLQY